MGKKSRDFVEDHGTELIISGFIIAFGAIFKVAHIYHKNKCADWGLRGLVMGFHGAINWFDEEFTELNLNELYNEWARAHPEEILYI